jgi:hypothetical protein
MAKHTGLLLSSLVASALVSLAAAPAQAQTAFEWAEQLVTNVTPEANTWGSPCDIVWGNPVSGAGYSAKTNGACLFTQSLKKADPTITNSLLTFWFGSASPDAMKYHDYIAAENKFENITDFALAQPGDVLATKYTSNGVSNGYLMILAHSEYVGESNDVSRYLIQVYDSTRAPHADTDTRWNADMGAHDYGVGTGYLYIDTNPLTGAILAHSWSLTLSGTYYTQEQRHVVAGRFVR